MDESGREGHRPRRGNKREQTRARLIEAASEVIAARGYERTTLEEVAARAGMTRGAIYGNFEGKEDLFLAVVETHWRPIIPRLRLRGSFREHMRALGEAVVAAVPERRRRAIGALSFQIFALEHEDMRRRLVRENGEIYDWAAQALLQFVPESELPLPVDQFVKVLHALTDGLLFARFLAPELITDKVIVSAFEGLAGPARGPS